MVLGDVGGGTWTSLPSWEQKGQLRPLRRRRVKEQASPGLLLAAIGFVPGLLSGLLFGALWGWRRGKREGRVEQRTGGKPEERSGGSRSGKKGGGLSRGASMGAGSGGNVPDSASSSLPPSLHSFGDSRPASRADDFELKMVLVVRQDLKMTAGKAAAQCAHAAVGIFSELSSRNKNLLRRYEDCGQPKIVVVCKNMQEMNELKGKAQQYGLPTFTVADAGRTQVAAGSKTVMAIGPGSKSLVDQVTRHLKLL